MNAIFYVDHHALHQLSGGNLGETLPFHGRHLAKEKETPEEQVSMEFLEGLNEAHMEADKVRQRKRLAAPHFAKEEVPEKPKEITDFFKHFDKTSEADNIA